MQRIAEAPLRRLFQLYPVVTLTGPRQSGKTTICREVFSDHPYANLESGDVREFAREDPRGFLAQFPDGAVIDEFQHAPDLASYIQAIVDADDRPGRFVLIGSQQLAATQSVSRSLAGRTGILTLLPLSIAEADAFGRELTTDDLLFAGFYPRGYDRGIDPTQLLGDYVETYVERDVRRIIQVRDLTLFRRFIKLCAGRTGQLINYQNLGNDAGVSHSTAREWLSVLEATYVTFLLPPFHANVSKRLIKSPKLYFHDVGLAAYLLGIDDPSQILTHPLRGPLFENLVISEALKHRLHQGRRSNLHFYRDSSGLEIDAIQSRGDGIVTIEAKSATTFSSSQLDALRKIPSILPDPIVRRILVHDGERTVDREDMTITTPRELSAVLEQVDPTRQRS